MSLMRALSLWITTTTSTGCPKRCDFQNAAGATVHQWPAPLSTKLGRACVVSGNDFFGRCHCQRLSRIQRSKVVSVEKTSPQHLIMVRIFWKDSESHFFWDTLCMYWKGGRLWLVGEQHTSSMAPVSLGDFSATALCAFCKVRCHCIFLWRCIW